MKKQITALSVLGLVVWLVIAPNRPSQAQTKYFITDKDTHFMFGEIANKRIQIGTNAWEFNYDEALKISLLNQTNMRLDTNISFCFAASNIVLQTTNRPVVTKTTNGWMITLTNK